MSRSCGTYTLCCDVTFQVYSFRSKILVEIRRRFCPIYCLSLSYFLSIIMHIQLRVDSPITASLLLLAGNATMRGLWRVCARYPIGLYRDVWIAAIASSTTSLATRTAAICVRFQGRRVRRVTSQCRLRSLRENPLWSVDGIYVRESPASLSIAMAFWR